MRKDALTSGSHAAPVLGYYAAGCNQLSFILHSYYWWEHDKETTMPVAHLLYKLWVGWSQTKRLPQSGHGDYHCLDHVFGCGVALSAGRALLAVILTIFLMLGRVSS